MYLLENLGIEIIESMRPDSKITSPGTFHLGYVLLTRGSVKMVRFYYYILRKRKQVRTTKPSVIYQTLKICYAYPNNFNMTTIVYFLP